MEWIGPGSGRIQAYPAVPDRHDRRRQNNSIQTNDKDVSLMLRYTWSLLWIDFVVFSEEIHYMNMMNSFMK